MKTNIYVPDRINVGYQNRKDTYTGKLAYVIYFDQKGKLRKETSWQSWRDESLGNDVFTNEPTEGFVINKKTGGVEESWGWDVRKTYARVYDPRGFEFEITIPNLLWILECCNCIKGKGLEGQFVYGWDGKELVLVPVDSPDYKAIQEKTKVVVENTFVKPSELVIGYTYEKLDGSQWVYMGKSPYFYKESNYQKELGDTWHRNPANPHDNNFVVRYVATKEQYWFIRVKKPDGAYSWERDTYIDHWSTVNRKLVKCISTNTDSFADLQKMINAHDHYSPIDFEKGKIIPMTFDHFKQMFMLNYPYVYINRDNQLISINFHKGQNDMWIAYGGCNMIVDPRNMYEAYQKLCPVYSEEYCISGELHRRYGYEK